MQSITKLLYLFKKLKTVSMWFCILFTVHSMLFLYANNVNKHSMYTLGLLSRLQEISALSFLIPKTNNKQVEQIVDVRISNLKTFFRKYNSDLYDESEHIVAMADKYSVDYRIVPSIAMQESTGCKRIPPNSYNCWGWGIYGNKVTSFSSYKEAIEAVTKGLKKNYVDRGLTTPEEIMTKYNPGSPNGAWAKGVGFFFNKLEE
jgi:hypothetical protein